MLKLTHSHRVLAYDYKPPRLARMKVCTRQNSGRVIFFVSFFAKSRNKQEIRAWHFPLSHSLSLYFSRSLSLSLALSLFLSYSLTAFLSLSPSQGQRLFDCDYMIMVHEFLNKESYWITCFIEMVQIFARLLLICMRNICEFTSWKNNTYSVRKLCSSLRGQTYTHTHTHKIVQF